MVLACILALAVGIIQVVFDVLLSSAIFAAKTFRGILLLLVKLVIYGVGFALVFFLFKAFIKAVAIGFAIGFFPLLIVYTLYRIFRK